MGSGGEFKLCNVSSTCAPRLGFGKKKLPWQIVLADPIKPDVATILIGRQ
jgi:hypothetical protein